MKTKSYSPTERPTRLSDLGLNEGMLLQAVQQGQGSWVSCTSNHPPLYRGIAAWAETVSGLREQLLPLGWRRVEQGNLPLTVSEKGNIAITVSTGDEQTGRVDGSPCTRSSKGPRTKSAVTANALQLKLFGDIPICPEDLESINGQMTFILLFHRDTTENEIRCELSRPIKMNVEGQVAGWAERIILEPMPFGSDSIKLRTSRTPEIIVEVKRKRA
ncbi:MAG TPA: hypothetical protein VGY91_00980 [Chthoniobacterales bacterium]|nr:hypothetical protein [Chthoniobacterales bacterium]